MSGVPRCACWVAAVGIVALGALRAGAAPPLPQAGAAETRSFTLVLDYHYAERTYDPPVVVSPVSVATGPATYNTPEEAFIAQVSAMKALDFDAWLRTWDDASQKEIAARDEKEGKTREERLEGWKKRFVWSKVTLVRWIRTGQHVVLTYKLATARGEDLLEGRELAAVFHLAEGGWRATLDLEDDPVVQDFARNTGEDGHLTVETEAFAGEGR